MSKRSVERFLNAEGQLKQWPTKRSDKDLAVAYLAGKFALGTDYTEPEVNELLKQWHTFSDWPLLRRELFEAGYLGRVADGSRYWLTEKASEQNPEGLPVIQREIASVVVFSSDGAVLLGRKAPKGGGVYADSWHLPGGGVESDESLVQAAVRELNEEVEGLDVTEADLQHLGWLKGSGATPKTLSDGSKVWCEMTFNYFRYVSSKMADELKNELTPGSDFVELLFFTPQQLAAQPTVPGGIESKIISGELTAKTAK